MECQVKSGRPPKGALKRSRKVTVAFSEEEYCLMKDKATLSGLSPAAYCRRAAVRKEIREALTYEDRKLLQGLWNIGNNLNQIARALNARGNTNYDSDLKAAGSSLSEIISHYRRVLRYGR